MRPGPNDELVVFDRGEIRVEVIVRDGKRMTYEQVTAEARALLHFEVQTDAFRHGDAEIAF